jgi:hypothetical protein
MYGLFATPNMYRTASGAPGQNIISKADYKMEVELDDKTGSYTVAKPLLIPTMPKL